MALPTEAVTVAGSGLVFINSYDDSVGDAYRGAILTAENFLQSQFTNSVTVSVKFLFAPLAAGSSAQNNFTQTNVSYSAFTAALRSHAVTGDDLLAVNGLPGTDPSGGAGFAIPNAEARILGLASQTNKIDDTVTLNANLPFSFGQDAIGAVQHEITEGVFGRTSGLGLAGGTRWEPLDLFRFTAGGQRDFTGGSDGAATFFGVDANHVSGIAYHSAISVSGAFDGQDLGDWDHTRGDAFGPGGPSSPGVVTALDLQVLDVLGWNSTPFAPAADDFASSLTDSAHPFGQLTAGGSATGTLQQAGDHDWFRVQLLAGGTYTINEVARVGGGGTVGDTFLTLHDSLGAVVASNDDISNTDADSRLVFQAASGGTYYVDAGGFVDGYTGSYTVSVSPSSTQTTASSGQVFTGANGGDTVQAGSGGDTVIGGNAGAGANVLRGNDGDDSISGGTGFDDANGNMGNDTIHGNAGNDFSVGGKDNDVLFGDAGDDIVWGNLGNDTCDGGDGADQCRGGQGDDSVSGGAGADFISGDRGNDTESGGAGADIFHGSQDAGIDRVLDFSVAEGDRVMLDPGTTFSVSQSGADTVIDMGAGNQMILVGVSMAGLLPNSIFLG